MSVVEEWKINDETRVVAEIARCVTCPESPDCPINILKQKIADAQGRQLNTEALASESGLTKKYEFTKVKGADAGKHVLYQCSKRGIGTVELHVERVPQP